MRAYSFGIAGWLVLVAFHFTLGRRMLAFFFAQRAAQKRRAALTRRG